MLPIQLSIVPYFRPESHLLFFWHRHSKQGQYMPRQCRKQDKMPQDSSMRRSAPKMSGRGWVRYGWRQRPTACATEIPWCVLHQMTGITTVHTVSVTSNQQMSEWRVCCLHPDKQAGQTNTDCTWPEAQQSSDCHARYGTINAQSLNFSEVPEARQQQLSKAFANYWAAA